MYFIRKSCTYVYIFLYCTYSIPAPSIFLSLIHEIKKQPTYTMPVQFTQTVERINAHTCPAIISAARWELFDGYTNSNPRDASSQPNDRVEVRKKPHENRHTRIRTIVCVSIHQPTCKCMCVYEFVSGNTDTKKRTRLYTRRRGTNEKSRRAFVRTNGPAFNP